MGEAGLVDRVLAGDVAAMERLVQAAWPRLGGLHRLVEPAELRQEALAELVALARGQLRRPAAGAGGGAQHDAAADDREFAELAIVHLRRRMAQVARAAQRRSGRLRSLGPADEERAASELETGLDAQVGSPDLAGALRRLAPRERAVIARVYWQEMTAAEIAARDGVDPAAIRKLRRRAEAELRRMLGPRRPGRR